MSFITFYILAALIVMMLFCALNSKRSPRVCLIIALLIPITTLYFIGLLEFTISIGIIVTCFSFFNLMYVTKQFLTKN
ncbi:hypothetical protein [Massilibacterium senegalense]|uniref:hypothetical protein n=1 Tax=Massilibacterium senegalense TaxID=1632858 RepID=UPI0011C776F5|nr:hypothetical protein [Massilibacterium senegalense]